MTDNTTKVISARVPMGNYVQIVAAASERKMTIADFVLLKLFAPSNPNPELLQQANQQIQHLKAQRTDLETTNTQLARNVNTWKDTADSLQIDHDNLQKERDQAISRVQQLSQERAQQQGQIEKLTQQLVTERNHRLAAQKKLVDLREALVDAHNDSGLMGHMGEKYWTIIDHFILQPPKK